MKKEIKSYEELLKCDGMKFQATYLGKKTKGVIFVDSNKDVFCLQDDFDGSQPVDNIWENCGYLFSWVQFKHIAYEQDIVENTFKNITVEVEEEWKPKFGEVVYVSNIKTCNYNERIFLFEHKEKFYCVDVTDENDFNKGEEFRTICWNFIQKYEEPKLELNWEEARQIIAEAKGVKAKNVNLKIK